MIEALLDSWDRNNTILINLLRAIPEDAIELGSPSIVEMFTHMHYVRLVFVEEDAPEFARPLPKEEWAVERDRGRLAEMLNESAKAVRDAVRGRLEAGRQMDCHYDHPILMLQHLIWHEGYHHGQIKLALKAAGRALDDEAVGPGTWGVWMRKTAAFLMAVSLAFGQADRAAPRTDRNSQLAHEQHLAKAKQGRIDIYFQGDSIARRWGATDYPQFLENWKQNFFGWNAADFAWGADRTEHILWRLENGELDGVNPKVIVLLAGTNNVGRRVPAGGVEAAAEEVTRGLRAIVRVMREKAPDAVIIVTGIFPRNDSMEVMPVIDRINGNLARMADGKKIRFLNVNGKLADASGVLHEGMMNADKLHPALPGYQVWADGLKPMFREILGPPGGEDHAPPPTGDPSAKK